MFWENKNKNIKDQNTRDTAENSTWGKGITLTIYHNINERVTINELSFWLKKTDKEQNTIEDKEQKSKYRFKKTQKIAFESCNALQFK